MLKHTKRQVNEFCFPKCVLLSCLSPQFVLFYWQYVLCYHPALSLRLFDHKGITPSDKVGYYQNINFGPAFTCFSIVFNINTNKPTTEHRKKVKTKVESGRKLETDRCSAEPLLDLTVSFAYCISSASYVCQVYFTTYMNC